MQTSSTESVADIVELRRLVRRLIERKWWVLGSTFGCAAAFLIAAFIIAPVYKVQAVLTPASSERSGIAGSLGASLGQLGGLASLAGISFGAPESDTEEAIAVLQSKQFTEAFIEELKLRPILFAERWDAEDGKWKSGDKEPTSAKAFRLFDRSIRSVTRDRKTGLITLTIEWKNRQQATDWANQLVAHLNSEMRGRALTKSEASLGYLEKELVGTTAVATRDAINRLIEAQVKQRMLANVTQDYSFRVVDKAILPDPDEFVWPRKSIMLLLGTLVGFAIAVAGVFLFEKRSSDTHG